MLLSKFFSFNSSVNSRNVLFQLRNALKGNKTIVRNGSSRRIMRAHYIFKSNTFKNLFIRYLIIGIVPCVLLAAYCNLFIGDAVLYDHDPDVFEPEYWEYYKNPLTRFLAKYLMEDPKLSYYKDVFIIEQAHRTFNQVKLVKSVEALQRLEGEGVLALQKDPILDHTLRDDVEEYYRKNLKEPPASSN